MNDKYKQLNEMYGGVIPSVHFKNRQKIQKKIKKKIF